MKINEDKVKMSVEITKKDYENYLFLIDSSIDDESDKVWKQMASNEIKMNIDTVAKHLGVSKKYALVLFLGLAVLGRNIDNKNYN